ncbi:MAG: hypothetical protein FWH11_05125 [Micrococcales bacterium]|nr:hypothetical protein [Micrococcales bacterium]
MHYAFALPGNFTCEPWLADIARGMHYAEICDLENGADLELELWSDASVAADEWTEDSDTAITWTDTEGNAVGTFFQDEYNDGYAAYCYESVPACLTVSQSDVVGFGTLSPDQIQRVADWLDVYPLGEPTAGWSLETALQAFPAAPGAEGLTCEIPDSIDSSINGEQYSCQWPSDDYENTATIIRWSTAQEVADHYSGRLYTQIAWMGDGVERGSIFLFLGSLEYPEDSEAIVWCYSDIPYCLSIDTQIILVMDGHDFPFSRIERVAPLTADQAAALGER